MLTEIMLNDKTESLRIRPKSSFKHKQYSKSDQSNVDQNGDKKSEFRRKVE